MKEDKAFTVSVCKSGWEIFEKLWINRQKEALFICTYTHYHIGVSIIKEDKQIKTTVK